MDTAITPQTILENRTVIVAARVWVGLARSAAWCPEHLIGARGMT